MTTRFSSLALQMSFISSLERQRTICPRHAIAWPKTPSSFSWNGTTSISACRAPSRAQNCVTRACWSSFAGGAASNAERLEQTWTTTALLRKWVWSVVACSVSAPPSTAAVANLCAISHALSHASSCNAEGSRGRSGARIRFAKHADACSWVSACVRCSLIAPMTTASTPFDMSGCRSNSWPHAMLRNAAQPCA